MRNESVSKWRENNPDKRSDYRKRDKLKRRLRNLSVLPEPNEPLNENQELIIKQINEKTFIMPQQWSWIRLKDKEKITQEQLRDLEISFFNKDKLNYQLLKRGFENSKVRNLEFNIDITDIVIPDKCPFFNIPFNKGRFTHSIDRIDSTKGYVKGNIQIISRQANVMKMDSTKEELINFAKGVLSILS
jgi:hypothetical protein